MTILLRIKSGVDKSWPESIPASFEGNEKIRKDKEIPQRPRKQKCLYFAVRELRPQGLKRKLHEKIF